MKTIFPLLIFGIAVLALGAVTKKQDPILLTQTEPVAYQEKLKEEEEGKKGPPAPTLKLFPKERFLSEGPVEEARITEEEIAEMDLDFWFEEEGTPPAEEEKLGEPGEEEKEEAGQAEIPGTEDVKTTEGTDDTSGELEDSWWEEGKPS